MILKRIQEFKDNLDLFDSELDKYEYIIEFGKSNIYFDEKKRYDEFLIKGCTSKLWLYPELKHGLISFYTDSDSAIVKGLGTVLQDIFSNCSADEIINFNDDLLSVLGLSEIISVGRQNGFSFAVQKIKEYAHILRKNNG